MGYAVLKLMNGDEIIAEVLEDTKESYKISQPVQIHRHISPVNSEVVRCSYWLLFSEKHEIDIDKKHVLVMSGDISKNVVKHYEFFLKHAEYGVIESEHDHLEEMVERAEQEYKEKIMNKDDEDKPSLRDLLLAPANTTIH